ncbi:MAG: cellobiose phosphorylase [Candidatus Heimdallarchaeota archaeon]|nr:MAG: cellobiose phosphorylase [Candidatus Heimdallarchaeota archaeon]
MKKNYGSERWTFINEDGEFCLDSPDKAIHLYFPLVNEMGIMSSITPELHGDIKIGYNNYLLTPVSIENLHNTRNNRDFWCFIENKGVWSVSGNSPHQRKLKFSIDEERVKLEAGFLWHRIIRKSQIFGIQAQILNFIPSENRKVELMEIKLTNIGEEDLRITPTSGIPLFCRSADNLRDHRHVTSLLHRIQTEKFGITVKPTFSFDERGHKKNEVSYGVFGVDNDDRPPLGFFPLFEDFVGEGGTLDWPEAIVCNSQNYITSDQNLEGYEAIGALKFNTISLSKGDTVSYRIVLSITEDEDFTKDLIFLSKKKFTETLKKTKYYWKEKLYLSFKTNDNIFDKWLKWVTLQPILRRIFGCSFLPHHDYGRGGRGWRDIWQDCLALLLMEPKNVRNLLLNNFAGIRFDGSNATIIGIELGEFKADRNDIPRTWSDHGTWPFMTTKLFIDQSGDIEFLLEPQYYFKDKHINRCTAHDTKWNPNQGTELSTENGLKYKGSILEHLLIQHLSSFFNVGENNNILLEGADWNDGLDMAREKGETVAFTAFFGSNILELANLLKALKIKRGIKVVELAIELNILLDTLNEPIDYSSPQEKREILGRFYKSCSHTISGEKVQINIETLISDLEKKGTWITNHIRTEEWIKNNEGYSWFNGYYDNDGKRLEGDHPKGVRMTLTGQVFPLMGGIASDEQVKNVISSVNNYLWDENVGGVRLNTNFNEILLNMGRCFGFAYGHKENGAMFSHMAVMYANALYTRRMAHEGFSILETLFRYCVDFNKSKIYPGIPEYVNQKGRGMYHYLTGSASWIILTLVTRVFGIRGELGDLLLDPMLLSSQFRDDGTTQISTQFAARKLQIMFRNKSRKDFGEYQIKNVYVNQKKVDLLRSENRVLIPRQHLEKLDDNSVHHISIELD